jgi:hypothetical protein
MKRCRREIGLFVISDTDKQNDDIFTFPGKTSTLSLSLNAVNRLLLVLMGLSIISSGALLGNLWFSLGQSGDLTMKLLTYAFPALVLGSLAYVIYWLRHKTKKEVLNRIPKLRLAAWKDIRHLTIDQVIDMAAVRVTSLFALASSVFMKRIRSLVFARVYEDEQYEDKRISNLIYELDGEKKPKAPWLNPSKEMQAITRAAADMPTTLWFDDPSDLQRLIACGEYTICYNLIDHILRRYKFQKSKYPVRVKDLFERLVEDWEKFEQNPMMMTGR